MLGQLKHLFDVWWMIVWLSLKKISQSRVDILLRLFRALMLILMAYLLLLLIFSKVDAVAGWDIGKYMLLLGYYNLVGYIGWGIFNVNLWRLFEKYVKGETDLSFIYPVPLSFSLSFWEFFPEDALAALSGVVQIGYFLVHSGFEWGVIAVLVVLFPLALLLWFSINLLFVATTFIIPEGGALEIAKSLLRVSTIPDLLIPNPIRLTLTYLLPVLAVSVIPVKIALGQLPPVWIICLIIITFSLSTLSHLWLRFCLRWYNSYLG